MRPDDPSPDPAPALLLAPTGRLDADTCVTLRQQLAAAFAAGVRSLVVDLSGVTVADLTGLGVLSGAAKHLRKQGGGLVVSHCPDSIATSLRINGLGHLLELAASPPLRVVAGAGERTSKKARAALTVVRPTA